MRALRTIILWSAAVGPSLATAQSPSDLSRWLAPQAWRRDTEGPILSLGQAGDFDDMHIFAPAVATEDGRYLLWYSGSRGTPGNRVFRLGLVSGTDGKRFERHPDNPILQFADGAHSVLTPALLRNGDGTALRENGKFRLWFSSATLGKGGLHTLHESSSADGIHWAEPSTVLMENVYCPSVLKTAPGYEMWFSDVSRRPWLIRHAASTDGSRWTVTPRPALQLTQSWEGEVLTYPTVLKIDDNYLMWYGSYFNATRRETTAIGFAVSRDGVQWTKNPQNPVLRPDPERPWESNYVGSGCVMRLVDGTFRYWYASRKAPPFLNLYFAINTARWSGPPAVGAAAAVAMPEHIGKYLDRCAKLPRSQDETTPLAPLPLPPEKGDVGILAALDARLGKSVDVLEVVDDDEAIVRAWYSDDATFVDLWLQGIDTSRLAVNAPAKLDAVFHVTGSKLFDTTCGKRSLPLLEPIDITPYLPRTEGQKGGGK